MKAPVPGPFKPPAPRRLKKIKMPTDAQTRKRIADAWRQHKAILKQIAGE